MFARRGLFYASAPPRLFDFRCPEPNASAAIMTQFARGPVACPDEWIIALPRGVVLGGCLVLNAAGQGLAESFAEAGADDFAAGLRDAPARLLAGEAVTPPADVPVVQVFTASAGNYGHLLADVLPRLLHVAEFGLRRFAVPVPRHALPLWPVLHSAAARLGLEATPIACAPGLLLQPAQLFWAGPVSRHNRRKSPTLRRLARALAPPSAATRRLFVTRPPGANRAIANQAALEAMVRAAGWEVVEPSLLPFAGQVALFATAARVLGPLGAGLCNAMFMPEGGRLAMISGRRFDVFFWDLACALGLGMDWVFTEQLEPYRPEHLWAPAPLRLQRMAAALAWLG